jgi:hypothetical protein
MQNLRPNRDVPTDEKRTPAPESAPNPEKQERKPADPVEVEQLKDRLAALEKMVSSMTGERRKTE